MEYFLHCIAFIMAFQGSEECNPIPTKMAVQAEALLKALATAEQSSVEGRIAFNLDQPKVSPSSGLPICNGPAKRRELIRPRLGQTAVFSCPVNRCESYNSTCEDLDELLWKHDNYSIWHVLCEGEFSPFKYSQNRTATTAYLLIHNTTYDSFGIVSCWCGRDNETHGLCLNEAYSVMPLLTPADVFQMPVLNVTRRAGENVTLISQLRIRVKEYTEHRYIVRYNRSIIWAQTSHPLHALIKPIFPHGVHFTLNDGNITITLPYLPKSFTGQFEVWVRPYMDQDEFVVQIINLKLI